MSLSLPIFIQMSDFLFYNLTDIQVYSSTCFQGWPEITSDNPTVSIYQAKEVVWFCATVSTRSIVNLQNTAVPTLG